MLGGAYLWNEGIEEVWHLLAPRQRTTTKLVDPAAINA
jgi:predicted DNA repair protein MutK